MKVVKRKLDGKIVYCSEPEFEEGFGIKNAIVLVSFGGIQAKPEDFEEIEIDQEEWDKYIEPSPEQIQENKIQAEMQKILREQAITSLKAKGEI